MKVLVIGGNRFFGRRLVEKLARQQVDLTVMNRTGVPEHLKGKVRHLKLDRKNMSRESEGLAGVTWDVVYDQVCYDATEASLACKVFEGRVGKYIFTSSMSVYGWGQNLTEKTFNPYEFQFERVADRNEKYAEAKRQAESVFFKNAKFPVAALRFPIVMGEDDYTERLKFHVDRVVQSKPIYFPDVSAKISFIHAADAARFMAFLAEKEFAGPINCCATLPMRLQEVLKIIEGKSGCAAKLVLLPTEGEPSPYGIDKDWTMSVDLQKGLGFECTAIAEWLPVLVARLLPPSVPHEH